MRRSVFVSSLVAIMAVTAAPLPALAAAPTGAGPTVRVVTQTVPLSQKACKAMAAADPQDAATILDNCNATVTSTLYPLVTQPRAGDTQAPAGQAQAQAAAASGCSWYGYGKADVSWQTWGWTVHLTTVYDVNMCNQVRFEYAQCGYSVRFPFTLSQTFCGVVPDTTYHNYTSNFVAMYFVQGNWIASTTATLAYGVNPTNKPSMSVYNLIETYQ